MPDLQSPKGTLPLIAKLTSRDDEVAEAVVGQLAALGETALPALFDLIESADAEKRWWALRALAVISHPEVPPRLWEALHDPDPAVQQCAALGLVKQPWGEATPDLIALLGAEDRLLARLSGDALIATGSPALPALITTLENGPQPARIEAARALALIGDKEAIPALFKAWQEGSSMVQHWAEEGLDRMGVGMQFFSPD
jgi:HEAT repeat protein